MRPKWLVECVLLFPFLFLPTSPVNTTECVDQVRDCNEVQHLCNHPEYGSRTRRDISLSCKCVDDLRCPTWFPFANCTVNSTDERRVLYPRSSSACEEVHMKTTMRSESPSRKKPRLDPARSLWGIPNTRPRSANRRPRPHAIPAPRSVTPRRKTPGTSIDHRGHVLIKETIDDLLAKSMNKQVEQCANFYEHVCGNFKSPHGNPPPGMFGPEFDMQERIIAHHISYVTKSITAKLQKEEMLLKCRERCLNQIAVTDKQLSRDLLNIVKTFSHEFPMFNHTHKVPRFSLTGILVKMAEATGVQFGYQLSVEEVSRDRFELTLRPPDLIAPSPDFYHDDGTKRKQTVDYVFKIVKMFAKDNRVKALNHSRLIADVKEVVALDRKLARGQEGIKEEMLSSTTTFQLKKKLKLVNLDYYVKNNSLFPHSMNNLFDVDRTIFVQSEIRMHNLSTLYNGVRFSNLRGLLNYLIVRLILQQVPYLDKRYVDAYHEFNHRVYKTPKPTPQVHCYNEIMKHFGLLADYLYITRRLRTRYLTTSFFNNQIQPMQSLIQKMLDQQTWITRRAKEDAKRRVATTQMVYRLSAEAGHEANILKEYEGINLMDEDSLGQMTTKLRTHRAHKVMMQLMGQEHVLIRHWPTTAVRIGNMKSTNTLFIPSALLITPFLEFRRSSDFNFGLLGSMVARELMHNLDDGGPLINQYGAYKPWWDKVTKANFKERAKELARWYNQSEQSQALRDLIADGGAIRVAYNAYEQHVLTNIRPEDKIPDFRGFFISYTAASSSNSDPQAQVRVNTILKNYEKFSEAFECEPDTEMNPTEKSSLWVLNPNVDE